jgi:hypothetical protein
MRHIDFDPASLQGPLKDEWIAWDAEAQAATAEAIKQWEESGTVELKAAVWGKLKRWLLKNVFHNKCAYCESTQIRDPGAADHFRPKGSVTIFVTLGKKRRKKKIKVKGPTDVEVDHPGYFWLAYHWKNLLPACFVCNSTGKSDLLPTAKAHLLLVRLDEPAALQLGSACRKSEKWSDYYYLSPEELNRLEDPLILNPYVDRPENHLRFGHAGIEAPVDESEKGKNSIETYHLHTDTLRQARQAAQEAAVTSYLIAMANCRGGSEVQLFEAGKSAVADYIRGVRPYSAAACDWVELIAHRRIRA